MNHVGYSRVIGNEELRVCVLRINHKCFIIYIKLLYYIIIISPSSSSSYLLFLTSMILALAVHVWSLKPVSMLILQIIPSYCIARATTGSSFLEAYCWPRPS